MEPLKHNCGVALIRLLKPLSFYERKYGTSAYVDLEAEVGTEYMFRERAEGPDAITEIFKRVETPAHAQLFMGHLRYSTTGKSGLTYVHPYLRRNNWRAKNLCLCGNFNMTNIDEVFEFLTTQGQSPRLRGDAYITLELMGHRLDREVERLFDEATDKGLEGLDRTRYIDDHICMANVLKTTMSHYDGGYVMCGLTGSGEMFAVRDPWGIRPAFYYRDEEIVALASERPVLQTTFNLEASDICELLPGQALIVRKNGESLLEQILPAQRLSACSFERIYFSRGSDRDVYQERKRLGEQLTESILKAVDGDVAHTVFSYIPNTAEVAFHGMTDGVRRLDHDVRIEKVVWKDIKLRTFITEDAARNDLAAHVYDVTYGSRRFHRARNHPAGEHLQDPGPSASQEDRDGVQFSPDPLSGLLRHRHVASGGALRLPRGHRFDPRSWDATAYCRCVPRLQGGSHVREPCAEDICAVHDGADRQEDCGDAPAGGDADAGEMLRPEGMQTPVELVFQSVEGLHRACPDHPGDWYFTGAYPTPGGVRLCNEAFVNYVENVLGFQLQL